MRSSSTPVEVDTSRGLSLADGIAGGLSMGDRRQLCASQPISGLSLGGGHQLNASQPIIGLSVDGGRQLSISHTIDGGGGGMPVCFDPPTPVSTHDAASCLTAPHTHRRPRVRYCEH